MSALLLPLLLAGSAVTTANGASAPATVPEREDSPPRSLTVLGGSTLRSPGTDVSIVGTTAYIGTEEGSVVIADLSDPRKPKVSGVVFAGVAVVKAVAGGDRVVGLVGADGSLWAFDPRRSPLPDATRIPTAERVNAVGVVGAALFTGGELVSGAHSHPPVLHGVTAVAVAAGSRVAVVVTKSRWFHVVDVSAAAPKVLGGIRLSTAPSSVAIGRDGVAYAASSARLSVVDFSDPSSPFEVLAQRSSWDGRRVISSPSSPVLVQRIDSIAFLEGDSLYFNERVTAVAAGASIACAVGSSELVVLDLTGPPLTTYSVGSGVRDVTLSPGGDVAYAFERSRFAVVPFETGVRGGVYSRSSVRHSQNLLAVSGSLVLLPGSDGIEVVDVSVPSTPVLSVVLPIRTATAVAASGKVLLVMAPTGLLSVFTRADRLLSPTHRTLSNRAWNTPFADPLLAVGHSFGFVVVGGTLYAIALDSLTVSRPLKLPNLLFGGINSIDAAGKHAFITTEDRFMVVTLAQTIPNVVGNIVIPSTGFEETRVAASGGWFVIVASERKVFFVNVSTPSKPFVVFTKMFRHTIKAVAASERTSCVLVRNVLHVFDVSPEGRMSAPAGTSVPLSPKPPDPVPPAPALTSAPGSPAPRTVSPELLEMTLLRLVISTIVSPQQLKERLPSLTSRVQEALRTNQVSIVRFWEEQDGGQWVFEMTVVAEAAALPKRKISEILYASSVAGALHPDASLESVLLSWEGDTRPESLHTSTPQIAHDTNLAVGFGLGALGLILVTCGSIYFCFFRGSKPTATSNSPDSEGTDIAE